MADLAELDNIAAAAAAGPQSEPAAAEALAPVMDPAAAIAADLAGLLSSLVRTLSPALPSLAEIYTPEVVGACSASVADVCVKHGWMAGGLGPWKEEIMAFMVLGPVAVATFQGVRGDIARHKAAHGAPAAAAAGAPATPGAASVSFGTVAASSS